MRYIFLERRFLRMFDSESFREELAKHLRRWGTAYLLIFVGAFLFQAHFCFGLNASASLSHRVFLIHKGENPRRGDYVAFRWHGGGAYRAGATFVKIISGLPGDTVTISDRDFFVNGTYVGKAKTTSRQGVPLDLGPAGELPAGRYYVRARHLDSLDSRYRLTGWISEAQIIGRAYALF